MCGICGIATAEGEAPPSAVQHMCDAITHRGPDDAGLYTSPDGRCVLGNRRLAIMDLSPAGHMPMGTEDGRYWISYNGEMYNFRALRSDLEARGRRFRSATDTEVVLQLYAEYGESCVARLNGMFAFAIWDAVERTLFLARDRMGIKPLYYAWAGDAFVFASEVRAILASGCISREADPNALVGYLMLGSVPDSSTIVRGIKSLPPGHCMMFERGRVSTRRYWNHAVEMLEASRIPADEVEEATREGLKDVVARQSVSDAPLGLFLSGGMDSGTIAALMRATGQEQIRSVSLSFAERPFDEGPIARRVAERFGIEHVEVPITPADVSGQLDRVIGAMDQPSTDAINTYFVSKAAREAGLTVALSGLGADELFGGYPSFQLVPRVRDAMSIARRIPGHETLLPLVARLNRLPYRARKLAVWTDGDDSLEVAYMAVRSVLSPRYVKRAAGVGGTFDPTAYAQSTVNGRGLNDAERISLLESRIYMHNQLLRDTDSMSMTHSLEVRVPYLDNDMIALAARSRHLLGAGHKSALASARSLYFPIGSEDGPKRGFSFPFAEWIVGPLYDEVRDSVSRPQVVPHESMARLWNGFRAGRFHWSAIWTVAVLERWLSVHRLKVGSA